MSISVQAVTVAQILPLRSQYRRAMNCQIVHDSLHTRPGWTQSYLLKVSEDVAGYAAIAIGGPWIQQPALFEFVVLPAFDRYAFDLFEALVDFASPAIIEVQTQSQLLANLLHVYAADIKSERILFEDRETTRWVKDDLHFKHTLAEEPGVVFRSDGSRILDWVVQLRQETIAKGGIGYHYNEPYGDLYMEVDAAHRNQGIGSFIVQELKQVCYRQGGVPAARCRVDNVASRKALMKAGFRPCGHILVGHLGKS